MIQSNIPKLDPPAIDFGLEPYGNYCEMDTPCYPHPPYGAWIGNAECLSDVKTDFLGVPRPNRAPNTLFVGDTGCDLGAFQFVSAPIPPPINVTVTPPSNLREVK